MMSSIFYFRDELLNTVISTENEFVARQYRGQSERFKEIDREQQKK